MARFFLRAATGGVEQWALAGRGRDLRGRWVGVLWRWDQGRDRPL